MILFEFVKKVFEVISNILDKINIIIILLYLIINIIINAFQN